MIPFLHLGPLTIPTFGLMVATALLVSAYVLQADFNRRRDYFVGKGYVKSGKDEAHHDEGFLIITIAGLTGLVGARLYHVLQTPKEFFADPWPLLFSRFGFAWFGGFLGGFIALVFLAKHYRIPVLEFMDLSSPAAAVGYAIGRIGCLLSGDGDYGIPTAVSWGMSFPNGTDPTPPHCVERGWPPDCRVHPTPIYEFLIWMVIAAVLWQMGKKVLNGEAPGKVFCGYLILTGVARFLVEFIRINPRSFLGFSNAQLASAISVLGGLLLLAFVKRAPATKS